MSIEWSLYEARPVGRLELVQAADRMAGRLLGDEVLDFSETLAHLGCVENSGTFVSQVYVTCGSRSALVDLDASPMINDDGSPEPSGLLFDTVSARRTLLSVASGLVVAVAWLDIAHGELTGSGLGAPYSGGDVDSLVAKFGRDSHGDRRDVVERLAHRVVGADADMQFS